jgi:hypothetical protein
MVEPSGQKYSLAVNTYANVSHETRKVTFSRSGLLGQSSDRRGYWSIQTICTLGATTNSDVIGFLRYVFQSVVFHERTSFVRTEVEKTRHVSRKQW